MTMNDVARFSKHFTMPELMCPCGCGRVDVDMEFIERLESLRTDSGIVMPLSSGFRCPTYNFTLTTKMDGAHPSGHGADILACGEDAFCIMTAARDYGFTGVGVYQHGEHSQRYIHLDDLNDIPDKRKRPMVWTYPQ
jgi:uncharacterized protein YcbK (DUF882 family)